MVGQMLQHPPADAPFSLVELLLKEGAAEAQQVPAAGRLQRLAQIFDGTARPQPA
jgi:hypothetical protein